MKCAFLAGCTKLGTKINMNHQQVAVAFPAPTNSTEVRINFQYETTREERERAQAPAKHRGPPGGFPVSAVTVVAGSRSGRRMLFVGGCDGRVRLVLVAVRWVYPANRFYISGVGHPTGRNIKSAGD